MTTPVVTIDSTGTHAPDFATVLQYLQDTYRSIYGADIYLGSDSQDGQFLSVLAQVLSDYNAAAVAVYNAFSPATAQGAGLSSVVKINGIRRNSATRSTVDVLLTGTAGTTITNGIVADDLDQQWLLPASVTIPGPGSVTVTATAREVGALTAGIDAVTQIVTPTRGWQSVTNASAAVPGDRIETDAALRVRQSDSVALSATTPMASILAAIANLSGVAQVVGYENDTDSTDGNGIPSHSIAVVVVGGDDVAIAETIAAKKSPGTGTYGTTSEDVVNASGAPLTVNFFRPTDVEIDINVTVKRLTGWVGPNAGIIKQALADYLNALPIGAPPSQSVQWSKLIGVADDTSVSATFNVTALTLRRDSDAFVATDVAIDFDERTIGDVANIIVTET